MRKRLRRHHPRHEVPDLAELDIDHLFQNGVHFRQAFTVQQDPLRTLQRGIARRDQAVARQVGIHSDRHGRLDGNVRAESAGRVEF